jgi:hypothetical protein
VFRRIGIAACVVVLFPLSTGTAAAAPPYYGLTYAEASERVSQSGGTPAIGTVIGDQLPVDKCIVVNSYGAKSGSGRWMFNLNCNNPVAEPGQPGNSAVSKTGAEAKKIKGYIEYWNKDVKNVESCGVSAASANWCNQRCEIYGGCSDEVLQYLAGKL